MSPHSVRVIKVGGSLLDLPTLANDLQEWLARQPPALQVLLVGGGGRVEEVRQWYAHNPLCEVPAHWLSIDLMTVTTRALQQQIPRIPLCERFEGLSSADTSGDETSNGSPEAIFFSPCRWLRNHEPKQPGIRLPASWDVTSDAIAARLAIVLEAEELVLLKSVSPQGGDLSEWAAEGYVDRWLPQMEGEIPTIRGVNLRSDRQAEVVFATPTG